MSEEPQHVVFGTGQVGLALAARLASVLHRFVAFFGAGCTKVPVL